jgi:thaumarchaeosortase
MLYVLDPVSFNYTWKGRTFYLFFIWLLFLELILDWEKLTQKNLASLKKSRIIAIGITASVPSVYVICVNFLGLNSMLIELGKQIGTYWHNDWPLSLEYLVFTIFFTATIWLAYEVDGLKQFSISLCLLGAIGTIYMIDTFYPYGTFTPFQALVPLTASSAARVLNWMGYKTFFMPYQVQGTPVLYVSGSSGSVGFGIGWPCAGVQSLFIYTIVILLFLKGSPFALKKEIIRASIPNRLKFIAGSKRINFLLERKIIRATIVAGKKLVVTVLRMVPFYIIVGVGAIGTYIVNVLRVVTIYIIALNHGDWKTFHDFYGEFYSMTWIIAYVIIIILIRAIPAKPSVLKVKLQKPNRAKDNSL